MLAHFLTEMLKTERSNVGNPLSNINEFCFVFSIILVEHLQVRFVTRNFSSRSEIAHAMHAKQEDALGESEQVC